MAPLRIWWSIISCHCFVDDWRLEHLWRRSGQGLAKAICSGIITAPDFSIERFFPQEIAQYQAYRSNLLAHYWQAHGVVVVPVLQWSNKSNFQFSVRYIEKGSVVAVRGPGKTKEEISRWIECAVLLHACIKPSLVLHFGRKVLDVWENPLFIPLHSRKNVT